MGLKILLVGARGLVGQGALKIAQHSPLVDHLGLLLRHPIPALDPQVQVWTLPQFSPDALAALDLSGFDACWYCAGTLPLGQTEAQYKAVTVDITLQVAQAFAAANPGARFLYISGWGAHAKSRLMPLRVKGWVEEALRALPLAVCCLRPGVVIPAQGARSMYPFRRVAYQLAGPILSVAAVLLKSQFTTTTALAQALLHLSDPDQVLPPVLENRAINDCGKINPSHPLGDPQ